MQWARCPPRTEGSDVVLEGVTFSAGTFSKGEGCVREADGVKTPRALFLCPEDGSPGTEQGLARGWGEVRTQTFPSSRVVCGFDILEQTARKEAQRLGQTENTIPNQTISSL